MARHLICPTPPRGAGCDDIAGGSSGWRWSEGPITFVFFGSVARGDDDETSDVDLLVDLRNDVGLVSLVGLERELSELLDADVDVVPASLLKSAVRESAEAEAIAL